MIRILVSCTVSFDIPSDVHSCLFHVVTSKVEEMVGSCVLFLNWSATAICHTTEHQEISRHLERRLMVSLQWDGKVAHLQFFWDLFCLQFHPDLPPPPEKNSSDLHDSHKLHILIENGEFRWKVSSLQACYITICIPKFIIIYNIFTVQLSRRHSQRPPTLMHRHQISTLRSLVHSPLNTDHEHLHLIITDTIKTLAPHCSLSGLAKHTWTTCYLPVLLLLPLRLLCPVLRLRRVLHPFL